MSMRPPFVNLDSALELIRAAPKDQGTLDLIARRPAAGTREVVDHVRFSLEHGVVGDGWHRRPSRKTGAPNPEQQVTMMNSRAIAAIAPNREDWPNAGDQLYADLDLSVDNLPVGTKLAIGTAVLQVSSYPHRGCVKFTKRFGADATKWLNTEVGCALRLRGVMMQVEVAGEARRGDVIRKR
ncbi:MAG: MOSC domain-containing protein [Myxococcota bacterium]|nr:MOSC domain-containing protein [Myxococcota bacterium]